MNNTQYSPEKLAEFGEIIQKKLDQATEQYNFIKEQITDITEQIDSEGDMMEDSSAQGDLEMMHKMLDRQTNFIADLKAAAQRVKVGTYGICVVTGELIDEKRLKAVPTTTKSLAAKNMTCRGRG